MPWHSGPYLPCEQALQVPLPPRPSKQLVGQPAGHDVHVGPYVLAGHEEQEPAPVVALGQLLHVAQALEQLEAHPTP